ncbi:hypothetical protein ACJX0J_018499, partial [Zea mays]
TGTSVALCHLQQPKNPNMNAPVVTTRIREDFKYYEILTRYDIAYFEKKLYLLHFLLGHVLICYDSINCHDINIYLGLVGRYYHFRYILSTLFMINCYYINNIDIMHVKSTWNHTSL